MKIVVLAGGLSPERDVSLSSGALIANTLMDNGHDVLLVDLYLGAPEDSQFLNKASGHRYQYQIPETEPDLQKLKAESGNGKRLIGNGVLSLCSQADVVFLALHGAIGENGQLQAVLDTCGVPYTGTGYAGSLLAMDKNIAKKLMREADILTPRWSLVHLPAPESALPRGLSLPCVIKPCGCGSSVGVSIIHTLAQYQDALRYAARYEDTAMVEEKIDGREFSVGILDGHALPVIEIIPKTGFYDYKNKYQAGLTEEICPAPLNPDQTQLLQQAAERVHQTLQLGFYSRVDFILTEDDQPYCLEANNLPGMTPTSLLPQEALAAGISYHRLCEMIVQGAVGK